MERRGPPFLPALEGGGFWAAGMMTAPAQQDQNYWRVRALQIAQEAWGPDSPLVPVFLRLINQESGFNPNAVSSAGAVGIAQFTPQTAAAYGIDPRDPEQSLRGAARHLTDLLRTFGGDVPKAVAAYNAGAGNVTAAIARGGDNWRAYLPDETKQYLSIIQPPDTVLSDTGQARAPGFSGAIGSILSGAAQRAGPDDPRRQLLTQLQQQLDEYTKQHDELIKKPNLSTDDAVRAAALRQAIDSTRQSIATISQSLRPVAGESPANLIAALTGAGRLTFDIARQGFQDNLDALKFVLAVLQENDKLAQDRFTNLLNLHRATTEDLQAIVAARHLLQADQLAIATQALARAGFIAQQRAWNATHLFVSATGTQPGFGLNEPAARGLMALGFTPVSPKMPAVNPADFDPLVMLRQAEESLTGKPGPLMKVPTEEDYQIPQLAAQAQSVRDLAKEVPSGAPLPLTGIAPQPPDYGSIFESAFAPIAAAMTTPAGGDQGAGGGTKAGQKPSSIDWSVVPGPTPAFNPPPPPTPEAENFTAGDPNLFRRFERYKPGAPPAEQPNTAGGAQLWP